MEVSDQLHAPVALPVGKKLGPGAGLDVLESRMVLTIAGFEPRIAQPIP
jgi:hypothetical protein